MNDVGLRYGLALFEVANEFQKEHEIFNALKNIQTVFQDDEIHRFFLARDIETNDKKNVLSTIFKEEDQHLLRFLEILIERHRLNYLDEILVAYESNLYDKENIKIAYISSAKEIDEHQINDLISALEHKYQAKIDARISINPDLISGLVIKIEDDILDSSMRNKLDQLSKSLKKGVGQHAA